MFTGFRIFPLSVLGVRRQKSIGPADAGNDQLFEPRLASVRLVLVETPDAAKKDVRMRIEAMLRMDPVPEPISFDTVIELKSGTCHLSGGDDAR